MAKTNSSEFEWMDEIKTELPKMKKTFEDMFKKAHSVLDSEKSIEIKDFVIDNINVKVMLKEGGRVLVQFPTEDLARKYFNSFEVKKSWYQKIFS